MFLHTFHPEPILAVIGPLVIHWYGLFLAVAALAGYVTFRLIGRQHGLKDNDLDGLFFWTVIGGLIGARLYHVTNEWSYYATHPADIPAIWNGGLAIHGALIAGLIVLIVYCRRRRLSFWRVADCGAPAVALGQAIGRWGNYFNQELYGQPTNAPWGIPIEIFNRPIEYIQFEYFHPTFLYESIVSLVIFALLVWLLHRRRLYPQHIPHFIAPAGTMILLYFMLSSLNRIASENLRIDQVPIIAGVRLPILMSMLVLTLAGAVFIAKLKKRSRV